MTDYAATSNAPRHGLARTLSRLGVCSRSEAGRRITAGRVSVNGSVVRDTEAPVAAGARIAVDGIAIEAVDRAYIALNKPRGLLVSTADEQGRDTVYELLRDSGLPWLAPVGRLDKASEGLLLLSNDPAWAARITDPATHVAKTYRVQVRGAPDAAVLKQLCAGIVDRGERLVAADVHIIGGGTTNTWCEVVLREGRNRQIRRMFAACGYPVVRLLRVAIGNLALGELPKGAWRALSAVEVRELAAPGQDDAAAVKLPQVPRRSTSRRHVDFHRPR